MHSIGLHVHSCGSRSLQILEKAAEIVGASDCASMVSECVACCRWIIGFSADCHSVYIPPFLSECAVNKVIVAYVLLSHTISIRAHTLQRNFL